MSDYSVAQKDFPDNVVDEAEENVPFEYSVTSYGADYTVDSLVTRLNKEVVFVPHFQREYVWTLKQASRFIESLLLGLPVPGVFFSRESETEKLLIVDGQQRLKSLQFFYNGIFNGKEFKLKDVQQKFEGKTCKTLDAEDRIRLDDSIIHATIVKQDVPSEDNSSIYHVFERLNTGGTPLHPQEIRACIHHGDLNDLLMQLRTEPSWQRIYGGTSVRMKDAELILRFFALYFNRNEYKRPMNNFLNTYMGKNRHLKIQNEDLLKNKFINTITFLSESLGTGAFRIERAINAAVFDAVMVGTAKRLEKGPIQDTEEFKQVYNALLQNGDFVNACQTGTSDEGKVKTRIDLAVDYFSEVK